VRGITRVWYGRTDDYPVPGDYDDDGWDDISIFRPSNGLWAVREVSRFYFGRSGDRPVPGIYGWYSRSSGFGSAFRTVPGIYRGSSGLWAIRGLTRYYYGGNLPDAPVIGDFTSDELDETVIFRPSSGLWAIRGETRIYYGRDGDSPVTR